LGERETLLSPQRKKMNRREVIWHQGEGLGVVNGPR